MTRDEAQRIAARLVTISDEDSEWNQSPNPRSAWAIRVAGLVHWYADTQAHAEHDAAELRAAIVRTLTEEPTC